MARFWPLAVWCVIVAALAAACTGCTRTVVQPAPQPPQPAPVQPGPVVVPVRPAVPLVVPVRPLLWPRWWWGPWLSPRPFVVPVRPWHPHRRGC